MSQKGPGESCFAKREKESSSPWNRDDLRSLAAKLYTKMVAAYGDTSWIAKSGKNEQQGYKFARAEDMYHQCREAFAKHGLDLKAYVEDGVIPEPPSLDELATEIATQKAVTN